MADSGYNLIPYLSQRWVNGTSVWKPSRYTQGRTNSSVRLNGLNASCVTKILVPMRHNKCVLNTRIKGTRVKGIPDRVAIRIGSRPQQLHDLTTLQVLGV